MNYNSKSGGHMIDLLFTLALFLVFAVSSLMVVVIGADVYNKTAESMNENFNMQTSLLYVTQKIRQNDVEGSVLVESAGDRNAVVLENTYNETQYQTWIYYDEGSIKELFIQKGNEINLSAGQAIMPVNNFNIEKLDENLYELSTTDENGKTAELILSPRS